MKEIKIYEIPNIDFVERIDDPYIGMIFYVADIDTYYSVKTLKEINGINMKGSKVVEYVIDEYADFGTGSGGGSGLTPTQLSNIAKIPAIQSTVDALPNNYASKVHNHSEYASSSHRHDASEIDNLPSGGGTGLTSTQKQQLQTAYEHSQSVHVQASDIPSLDGYATETFVTSKIAEASLSGGEVDLSGYATKDDLKTKANTSHTHTTSDVTDLNLSNIDAASLNGKKFSGPMTKAEYDAISDKDPNTIYLVDDATDNVVEGIPSYGSTEANKVLAVNGNGTALAWVDAPSGNGSGLTIEQANQLTAAYEHSQSSHVTSNDLSNIDAVSLNGKTISEPLSKVQYDAIVNKDANTIYLVEDDNAIIGVPDYSLADANKILALNNKGTQLIWKEAGSLDSITSPNGTKFRLVVDDAGNLSTEIVAEYGNIIVDPTSCNVNEGGRVTFTVKLDKAPSTNQTITINTDSVYLVPSPSTITFNSDNYGELQTITLTSSADDNEVNDIVLVTLSCDGIDSETITVNVKEANSYNAPTNPIPASDISLFSNCIDTTNFIFEATDTSVWDALSIGKITVPNDEAQHYKLHFTLLDKNFIDTETETFLPTLVYIITAVDTSHPNILIDGGSGTGDKYADKITAYIKEGRLHEELISEPFYIKSENVEATSTIDKIFGIQFKNTNTGNYLKAQIYIEKL